MNLNRPNFADFARTFAPFGETDSKERPEVVISIPPTIQGMMEICRPLSRKGSPPSATQPIDESLSHGFNVTVASGAGTLSTPIATLRHGIWRIAIQLNFLPTGGTPQVLNYCFVALVGPDGTAGAGVHLLNGANVGGQVMANGATDFLVHLPSDDWNITLEISDPVGAGVTNRLRGSLLLCRLL